MHHRFAVAAMAVATLFPTAGALHAAPFVGFHHGATDKSAGKLISFSVRNDSKSTLVLKAGEQQVSIEPGKTTQMKLAEGAEVVNVSGTDKSPAGTVLTHVDKQLSGNTLAVS